MVSNWATESLGDLCDFCAGSVFKPSLQGKPSGEFPFVKVSDMNLPENAVCIQNAKNWVSATDIKELRAKPLPPGSIIFAKIGEALRQNRLRQVARKTIVDNNMMGAVPHTDKIDSRFFYYALSQYDFSDIAQGTALPYLTIASLSALTLRVPPLPEQRRIAHILGTLDDKIENNRKTAKALEAMAQAIFQSWFVDFDPVRAKMAGESKESICKRLKLTPEILDLFPERLVDSELGEIPEGWEVGTFGDLAEIVGGSTPSTTNSEYWFSGIHSWATPKDLSGLTLPILLATENKITDAGLQQVSSRLLPIGTVLLSSRAPIGYLAITQIPVAINQGFIAMKPHNHEESIFLMLLVKHNMEEIISRANGSTFLEISKAKFRPIPVISPLQSILNFFAKLTTPLFLNIVSMEKITQSLEVQRDAFLPKLISGEICVPEAEHLIENMEG